MKKVLTGLLVVLHACTLLADEGYHHLDSNQKLGVVSFSISCSKGSQKAIEHGLALLHSFLFDDAEDQFKAAATEDSACTMAYWGEAIGLYRPLAYRPTDFDMKQGWALVQKAQTLRPKTQRERDYVEALTVFYRVDQRDYDTRNRQYSEAMEKVYKSYPYDQEAAIFYALSLLTSDPDGQHPLANPEKAIGILNQVFRENPDHPGVAHYLIHAADRPQLAQMGLEAARRYAQIAPTAPHALHMPSHIFARLGLWPEDIQSNLACLKAARDPAAVHVGAENQLHALEFLEYAYLQIGEAKKAEEMVREQAEIGYEQVDKNLVDYVNRTRANSPAMLYLESRNWKAAEALKPDPNAETYNQAITYWAQAVAAGHLRNVVTAEQAVHQYDSLLEATKRGSHSYRAKYMSTQRDEAHAWLSFVQGEDDEALRLLRAVADKQDVEGKGEVELPAREMLADILLEMNRPSEALAEFESSMRVDPNRFNELYGAGRAAELTHQTEKAATYYTQLLKNCDNGTNSNRPELAQARATAARPSDLAITHVTIINPGVAKPQPDMTILIRGRDIALVGRTTLLKVPASAKVIDGTGKFVIPGLWDMHSHFRDAARDLKMYVANGVLGIRNMGGVDKEVFPLRDAIAAGQRLGPEIVASGPIVDGPDSWSNPTFTVSVKTADEARSVVRSLKDQGADFIKVYDGLPRDAYYAIADETQKLGLPFAGHLPSAISVREASNAGQRTLEHGVALAGGSTIEDEYIRQRLDQSAFKEALRTKTFSLIPAKIARDDTAMLDHFSQERADETYRLLAKNSTFITPTLVTERALTFIDDLNEKHDPRMQYVSAEELEWWKPENGMLTKYRTPEYIAMRKREYVKMLEEVHRAQTLGVRLLAGTDITIPYTYPGFSLHDELKLFVEAGLTPMQALETSTTNPARLFGLSKTWGHVEPGYTANLVLLNADPLADISNTKKIDAVVVNGKLLDRTQLDQLLDEARAAYTGTVLVNDEL